jgi:hypothetical protein
MLSSGRRRATIARSTRECRAIVNRTIDRVATHLLGLRSFSFRFQRRFQREDSGNQRRRFAPVRVGGRVGSFCVEDHFAKLTGAELAHSELFKLDHEG